MFRHKIHDFFQPANTIGNSCLHRRRHTQRLVNARKIVVHEVKGNRLLVVFRLPGKTVS